jgi:hypothetical protein
VSHPALTTEGATAVYALLRLVGAPTGAAERFVRAFTTAPVPSEWRFQGEFGFGGKIRLSKERWCVTNYPEDDTPELLEKISIVNYLLEHLRQRFGGGDSFEQAQVSAQKIPLPTMTHCRFCNRVGEEGLARCPSCDRVLWRGRTTQEYFLDRVRQKDEEAVLEFDRLIEASRSSGEAATATWTLHLSRAGYARASAWDVEGMHRIAFCGAGWAVHLKS